MEFYSSISAYYDEIFPLKIRQLEFVLSSIENVESNILLDIGCGTGSLSIELAKSLGQVTGIDLDEAMLEIARSKTKEPVSFQTMDMLSIENEFGSSAFDTVLCFGNTLVHLPGSEAIQGSIHQAHQVLKPSGKLMLQIINYDRILDQNIKGLPTIENEKVRFNRNYNYDADASKIDFETILFDKVRNRRLVNHVDLYPIRKKELTAMLEDVGFTNLNFFGSFKKSDPTLNDQPLIISCRK